MRAGPDARGSGAADRRRGRVDQNVSPTVGAVDGEPARVAPVQVRDLVLVALDGRGGADDLHRRVAEGLADGLQQRLVHAVEGAEALVEQVQLVGDLEAHVPEARVGPGREAFWQPNTAHHCGVGGVAVQRAARSGPAEEDLELRLPARAGRACRRCRPGRRGVAVDVVVDAPHRQDAGHAQPALSADVLHRPARVVEVDIEAVRAQTGSTSRTRQLRRSPAAYGSTPREDGLVGSAVELVRGVAAADEVADAERVSGRDHAGASRRSSSACSTIGGEPFGLLEGEQPQREPRPHLRARGDSGEPPVEQGGGHQAEVRLGLAAAGGEPDDGDLADAAAGSTMPGRQPTIQATWNGCQAS